MLDTVTATSNIDPTQNPELAAKIDAILDEQRDKPGSLMVILNEVQAYIATNLHVPVSKVHGVISFYSFFTTRPRGKHTIKFCLGTACYVGGASQLIDKAKQLLGVELGETTDDGKTSITVEACRCVGACSQAPVVVIDDTIYGRVKPSKITQLIRALDKEE